ncbi:MAG: FkbM family methyltransferase [Opitutae bacterium]|nr:FkbM family methyltransferase [Opitutae bacterium]
MKGFIQRKTARLFTKVLAATLRPKGLEKILCSLCVYPTLCQFFKLGSLAYAYAAQLEGKPVRKAQFKDYTLYIHLKEPWGVRSYFFRESGAFPIIQKILQQGDIFIDAGANIGQFSSKAASILGPQGKVFAFEPEPNNRLLLNKTVAENQWEGQVKVSSSALWKETGHTLKFYPSQNPENTGTASLIQHGIYQDKSQFVQVKTVTLDDFFENEQIEFCRLMKIDVERGEDELLEGFSNNLKKQTTDFILIEMEKDGAAQDLLTRYGYVGFQLLPENRLEPIGSQANSVVNDFLFASQAKVEEVRQLQECLRS